MILLDYITANEIESNSRSWIEMLMINWHDRCFANRLLTLYNVQLRYVSPANLGMPDHVVKYVAKQGIPQETFISLEAVLADTDVLYMTRIQRERFATQEEYDQVQCLFAVYILLFSYYIKVVRIKLHLFVKNRSGVMFVYVIELRSSYFQLLLNTIKLKMIFCLCPNIPKVRLFLFGYWKYV